MAEVGIRALKQNASAVIADAVAGETITITDRGRPVARVTAIPTSRLDQLVGSGRARRPRRRIAELPAPEAAADADLDVSLELAAMRESERY